VCDKKSQINNSNKKINIKTTHKAKTKTKTDVIASKDFHIIFVFIKTYIRWRSNEFLIQIYTYDVIDHYLSTKSYNEQNTPISVKWNVTPFVHVTLINARATIHVKRWFKWPNTQYNMREWKLDQIIINNSNKSG
jgi:hypothetical protein